jgi:hypothetical protein
VARSTTGGLPGSLKIKKLLALLGVAVMEWLLSRWFGRRVGAGGAANLTTIWL